MSKRREPHPTESKDEKFFENRQKTRGEARQDFRPDPTTKSPPEPQRRKRTAER